MAREKFTMFILSNGRAGTLKTVDMLEEGGFTGDYYIVVDDLDDTLAEYKKNFGDKVVVFDKMAYVDKVDTMINVDKLNSPLYARKASHDLAKEWGIKFYGQFDDDISALNIRYESEGKLKSKKVTNLDKLFELAVDFMEAGDLTATGFGNSGGYIGGLEGKFKKGYDRQTVGTHIMNSEKELTYRGITNQDYNLAVDYGKIGYTIIEISRVAFASPARGTNKGGLYDEYQRAGTYTNFYSVMTAPSCVKLRGNEKGFGTYTNWSMHHAMIVSDKYKKEVS